MISAFRGASALALAGVFAIQIGFCHSLAMAIVLQLQGVLKSFGPRRLFDAATVSLAEGQRVGLVGANGVGKTTLLKMVLGQEEIDEGTVMFHPSARLGYLEQHEHIDGTERLIDYLLRVSGREAWQCAKVASSFDLTPADLEKPFDAFSGGYQMRVRLTAVLVQEPNLLLLDEPTNYLDLQTVLLLEKVLQSYRGALLLVSHDREFLKNVCTHTLELSHGKLTLFPGHVEAYLAQKEHQLKERLRYNQKMEEQRAHIQRFVDRFRANSTKATQVQSRLKLLAKLDTIEIAHSLRTVRIHIEAPPHKKGTALTIEQLSVGYTADKPVLREVVCSIERGDHVAILGENGQGKTTLLKTIAGELMPLGGSFKWGYKLRVGYYAQHVPKMLPKYGTAGSYLTSVAGSVLPEELLRMAGNFLFTKDDLEKPMSVLSGGERARLCLAALCLGKYDVLILDEPTNHLDFDTVEALGEALQEFPGTVIFVSHSRTFVSQIATTILDIRHGKVHRYPYPYEIYVHELKTREPFVPPKELAEEMPVDGDVPYVRCKTDVYHDIQKEKRALERLEKEMGSLMKERERIFQTFATDPLKRDVGLAKRLKEIELRSQEQEQAWFLAHDRLEAFEREMKTAKDEHG